MAVILSTQRFTVLEDWLKAHLIGQTFAYPVALAAVVVGLIAVALAAHFVARRLLVRWLRRLVTTTRSQWDDALVRHRTFTWLAQFVPAALIYFGAGFFPEAWQTAVERLGQGYMIVVTLGVFNSILSTGVDIYGSLEVARTTPIKGFVQSIKILAFLMGGICLLAALMGKDPWGLVAGVGAVTAVLLLVFKDSILGLVASVLINMNDMVHIGDWIEMPKYGADGDVVDITLTSVKVSNWDKTVTTIPTYALISEWFKNWRAMQESGGRRIKRAIHLDKSSIRFCTDKELDRLENIELLKDYIKGKRAEIAAYNKQHGLNTREVVNGRRLTNAGTFRAYLEAYLRQHPLINKKMTFLVRHLAPGPTGLPIEIYVFCSDTRWVPYEGVQADIFDHILAVIPEFGLRTFQNPTGRDFGRLAPLSPPKPKAQRKKKPAAG